MLNNFALICHWTKPAAAAAAASSWGKTFSCMTNSFLLKDAVVVLSGEKGMGKFLESISTRNDKKNIEVVVERWRC